MTECIAVGSNNGGINQAARGNNPAMTVLERNCISSLSNVRSESQFKCPPQGNGGRLPIPSRLVAEKHRHSLFAVPDFHRF